MPYVSQHAKLVSNLMMLNQIVSGVSPVSFLRMAESVNIVKMDLFLNQEPLPVHAMLVKNEMMLNQLALIVSPVSITIGMVESVDHVALVGFQSMLEVLHVKNVLLLDPILNLELLPVQHPMI
jgi:hypothetical protein